MTCDNQIGSLNTDGKGEPRIHRDMNCDIERSVDLETATVPFYTSSAGSLVVFVSLKGGQANLFFLLLLFVCLF